ncbi:MAG: hypothetical protein ABH864_02945 [archaeon]
MTTGPVLGTKKSKEEVAVAAEVVGFVPSRLDPYSPKHKEFDSLRLQIHSPSYLSDVKEIATEIEFDDLSNRWPDNFEARTILRRLYAEIPDLIYREIDQGEGGSAAFDLPVRDVSSLFR